MTRPRRAFWAFLAVLLFVTMLTDIASHDWASDAHEHQSNLFPGVRAALAQAGSYLQTFDGRPSAPLPFVQHAGYATLDVQVHSRGVRPWPALPAMQAQHSTTCAGPPATHATSSYEGAVFICNDHVMTAINGDEYGLIVLTPNRMLNVASGGTVSFDLSTEKMSGRDWWDVMISPWAENVALPLLSDLSQGVDLQGPPRNAILISTDDGHGGPRLKVVRNGVIQNYQTAGATPPIGQGVTPGTNQAATRQSFRFTAANGRMRFERLASATAPALVFWDVAATATFATGVVQFGHHSYDPTKDGAGVPATWHWDNLAVTNSSDAGTAFTIRHAAPRQLTSAGTVTFPAAPAGAYLRFAALCRPVVNGVAASFQPTVSQRFPEHASSYFVPIPTGSTSATIGFTADDWYTTDLGCFARDFHVWSLGGSTPPTPTPTPLPVVCSPRPPVTTTVVKQGDGVLQVTLRANGANNTVRRVDFTPSGALIRRSGFPDQTGPFSSTPQSVSTTFQVLQRVPNSSATVNLVVTDGCGTWTSFAGGGPSAF